MPLAFTQEDFLVFNFINVLQDKIILGSDYPFPLGELNPPGKVIDSMTNFSKELKVSLSCVFTHVRKFGFFTLWTHLLHILKCVCALR